MDGVEEEEKTGVHLHSNVLFLCMSYRTERGNGLRVQVVL